MLGIKSYLGVHGDLLSLRSKRNDILASNIANAATPHFKARDVDFEAELAQIEGNGALSTSDPRHIPMMLSANNSHLKYRVPTNPALDGNTVELGVEQMQFSENVVRYQTTLSFLNRRIAGLTSAIKGE